VTLQTTGENINVAWSPDGSTIAVGDRLDVVSFIDVRNASQPIFIHSQKMDMEINEIGWDYSGNAFYMTTGKGTIKVLDFPSFELKHDIQGHTSNIYCIDFDPKGRYFACGGADALTTLWDLQELFCIQTYGQLDWPIRTLSISYDGDYIALGSEEQFIDIVNVSTGERECTVKSMATTNTIAWHPSKYVLAFASDETDRYGRAVGNIRIKSFKSS
jgi:THO complex subunit 3